MTLKEWIKYFLIRTFRDEIIEVYPPEDYIVTYRDVGTRLEGYMVRVVYKYHGVENRLFPIDNDHFQFISSQRTLKYAQDFYTNARKKIEQAKQENANEKQKR